MSPKGTHEECLALQAFLLGGSSPFLMEELSIWSELLLQSCLFGFPDHGYLQFCQCAWSPSGAKCPVVPACSLARAGLCSRGKWKAAVTQKWGCDFTLLGLIELCLRAADLEESPSPFWRLAGALTRALLLLEMVWAGSCNMAHLAAGGKVPSWH